MKVNVFFLISILLFSSCNREEKDEKMLFKKVMDLHDEVMPEMGKLHALTNQIDSKIDSMNELSAVDSVYLGALIVAKQDLEIANESMMVWMRQFEPIEKNMPHDSVMMYLNTQKAMIKKVNQDIKMAKAKGLDILKPN